MCDGPQYGPPDDCYSISLPQFNVTCGKVKVNSGMRSARSSKERVEKVRERHQGLDFSEFSESIIFLIFLRT
jgi:hypothetical protein